jgi:hypothetical protein
MLSLVLGFAAYLAVGLGVGRLVAWLIGEPRPSTAADLCGLGAMAAAWPLTLACLGTFHLLRLFGLLCDRGGRP